MGPRETLEAATPRRCYCLRIHGMALCTGGGCPNARPRPRLLARLDQLGRSRRDRLSQTSPLRTHPGMTYIRRTHNRSQQFGGHTKHAYYCSCGRVVHGNGGRRHFGLVGHDRIIWRVWWQAFGRKDFDSPTDGGGAK